MSIIPKTHVMYRKRLLFEDQPIRTAWDPEEGSNELLTNCSQLKLKASDGKHRLTDVADTEQLLRIIQSIPSKKAEPFKLWLALAEKELTDVRSV